MRVVFDTNIYISALAIPGSFAEKAILKIIGGRDTLFISKDILNELLSALARKFSHDADELSRVAILVTELSEVIRPVKRLKVLKDDPDNRVLECAISAMADIIVTGDKEMLALKNYKGIRIISLREYLGEG